MAEDTDGTLLGRIDALVREEQQLYGHAQLSDHDQVRLEKIEVELDRCWDPTSRCRASMSLPTEQEIRKNDQLSETVH